MLQCNNGVYYVGHTSDLEKRLSEHHNGFYKGYTSLHLPVRLVFVQECSSRNDAFLLERKIKKWSRKKKEALIEGDFHFLSKYSKKKF